MDNQKRIQVNPITVLITMFVVVGLVLLGITLYKVFRTNPYGREVRIDNFSEYFSDAPEDIRDFMFARLYDIIVDNTDLKDDGIPKSGALIRNGSVTNSYDESLNMHYGRYIVDIKEVRRTFVGYFEWSNDKKNINYSGISTVYYCPKTQDIIYDDFECRDMFSDDISAKFPITHYLPETVEYYSNNYSSYTKYRIAYLLLDDNSRIVLTITDYTGGNREKALDKIREFGFNPDDYEIQYTLETNQDEWAPVGDN